MPGCKESNRKTGNRFEWELCRELAAHGYWAHNLAQNRAGQPADVIAVKNREAYLIDCKVCSTRWFELERVEENQRLSMELWRERGNGDGWFAITHKGEIRMVPYFLIEEVWMGSRSRVSWKEICDYCMTLEEWLTCE